MTVILTHFFKLLSFLINICCFLLVYLFKFKPEYTVSQKKVNHLTFDNNLWQMWTDFQNSSTNWFIRKITLSLPNHISDTVIVLFKISSGSISVVVHQILSKSDNIFTEIWWFNDFQNGGRPPSWILKMCSFCHAAFVGMPFCFLVQNFAEIRKSVELWPKKRFSRWRPPPSWI